MWACEPFSLPSRGPEQGGTLFLVLIGGNGHIEWRLWRPKLMSWQVLGAVHLAA